MASGARGGELAAGRPSDLPRDLTLADAVGVIVGIVIGSGIFMVAAEMTREVRTPALVLGCWVAGGLISFAGGITFAELGTRYPAAGGMYVYLREAFGPMVAFLYGWTLFLVVQTGSIAAVGVACAEHVAVLHPIGASRVPVVAVAIILGLSLLNALSTRASASVQNTFTLAKVLAIAALIGLSFVSGKANPAHFIPLLPATRPESYLLAIAAALVAALWAYDGWYQVGNVAGEMKDPGRDIPRALFIGLSIVCSLYVAVSGAYLLVLSPDAVAASRTVGADAARAVLGADRAWWIAALIVVSTFGCVNGMTLAGPRVYYAMARDGLFFRRLGEAHPVFRTPFEAVILQGVWSAILVGWGNYEQLFNYVMFTAWLFYGLAGIGLFLERRWRPDMGKYRAWGYPFTPALFVAASAYLAVSTMASRPREAGAGIAMLAAGLAIYMAWFRRPGGAPDAPYSPD
jgi:APA family basic amino acid/polyamine antiporter